MERTSLKWNNDIVESCRFIDKGINDQPTLVVAYLVASLLGGMLPGFDGIAKLFAQCVLLGVSCAVARRVWLDRLDEEERKAFEISHAGTPVHSLIFLQFLFYAPIVLPVFFVLSFMRSLDLVYDSFMAAFCLVVFAPTAWWAIKSGLAIVLVSVEDSGAIDAMLRSHKLLNGRFWWTFRYIAPIFASLTIPMCMFWSFMQYGYRMLMDQAVNLPITVGAMAVRSLLEAASYLFVQLLIAACLTRLYAYLKATDASKQTQIPV